MKKNVKILKILLIIVVISFAIFCVINSDFVNYYILNKGRWVVAKGEMSTPRSGATANLLHNGDVLIAGGSNPTSEEVKVKVFGEPKSLPKDRVMTAEIYHPGSQIVTKTGDLNYGRLGHSAVTLKDGRVLIAGGRTSFLGGNTNTAELYDPKKGKFTETGKMSMCRSSHDAVLLDNGKVLIPPSGLQGYSPKTTSVPDKSGYSGELYAPDTRQFTPTKKLIYSVMSTGSIRLPNGNILLPLGRKKVQIYNPKKNIFYEIPSMNIDFRDLSILIDPNTILIVTNEGNGFIHKLKENKDIPIKNKILSWHGPMPVIIALDSGNAMIYGLRYIYIYDKIQNMFKKIPKPKYYVSYPGTVKLKNGDIAFVGGLYRDTKTRELKTSNKIQIYKYKH